MSNINILNNRMHFVMVHSTDDNSVYGMNENEIVMLNATEENGKKCTMVYFDNEHSDVTSCTVNETCEKMVKSMTGVKMVMLHDVSNNSVVCVNLSYVQMFGKGELEGKACTEIFLTVQTDADHIMVNESPEKVVTAIQDKLDPTRNER